MHIVWIKKSALMLSGAKNQIKGVYLTTPRLRNNLKNIRGSNRQGIRIMRGNNEKTEVVFLSFLFYEVLPFYWWLI